MWLKCPEILYQWLKLQKKTGSLNHQARGTQLRKVDRKKLKEYLASTLMLT